MTVMLNGPQKIILIRAGRYDYAEVELGGSLQMVGPNNTGKTTLINTLQFLYLDDLRTMDFGSYSLEHTLAYYFPSQYSYVLFQCLAATGQCVIGWRGQSKTAGGDPERFSYQGPYDPEDFLKPDHQVREPRDISSRLALKHFRLIKSAQEHRELLLPPDGADGKGLGIVALRDPDRFRRFRDSLKDLLSLSSITQEQMRDRLLTLADVRTDVPALDARKLFGEDYDLIRRRRDALTRFKKHEPHVRQLVERSSELTAIRGELISRWKDLRTKRTAFDQAHAARLDGFTQEIARLGTLLQDTAYQLRERAAERDTSVAESGRLAGKLADLGVQAKSFAAFDPELAHAAEQNLKNEELRLKNLLAQAKTEVRDKVKQKIELYGDIVRNKQEAITNFDRLAVTTLRHHFKDADLASAFRVLNFDLLETPIGPDGITARSQKQLLELIRTLASRVKNGTYEDPAARIVLRPERKSPSDLADVSTLREQLAENTQTLEHWQATLKAIVEREQLAAALAKTQGDLSAIQKQIVLYNTFLEARANEPRLRQELGLLEQQIRSLKSTIDALERQRDKAAADKQMAGHGKVAEENAYNEVMGRFERCVLPLFSAKFVAVDELPEDFDSAISLFLNRQDHERHLAHEVDTALKLVAQLVGEEFNGADDAETIQNLGGELDALSVKAAALERDWTALIQGLRGMFAGVLKELDAVRSAVADLNRQLAKIQVSNLSAIKLEVLEAGDLVNWIKRLVDLQQPGLFDEDTHLDQTLRNFRQRLEGSPIISFSQLFSLQFTVVGEDGVPHRYQDFRQIESHGTTITIKVLFNLLVLRHYLRENQCVVPFFLDEIQALDPANRTAVLSTSRNLGFLAITASPEPVTEVESLYFLQPQQGRIVLRQRHRLGVKLQPAKL